MWTTDRVIAAPPEAVWALLVDFDAWPRWGPTIARATVSDSRGLALGSTGTVWTVVGVALPFTVTEFEPGRCWAWTVAGVPATRHEVRQAPSGSTVSFGVPSWAPAYLAVCAVALRRIDRMLVAPR